jgi:hypothetical protein
MTLHEQNRTSEPEVIDLSRRPWHRVSCIWRRQSVSVSRPAASSLLSDPTTATTPSFHFPYHCISKSSFLPSMLCLLLPPLQLITWILLPVWTTDMNSRVDRSRALPRLRRLVAGVSPQRPSFEPRSVSAKFVIDKVALSRFLSDFFGFPLSVSSRRGSPHPYVIWRMNNRSFGGRSSET